MNLKVLVLFWAFILVKGGTKTKSHIPVPIKSIIEASACTGKCSTWGKGLHQPFQGKPFHFSPNCKHVLIENCPNSDVVFGVYVKRNTLGVFSEINLYADGVSAFVKNDSITIDDKVVKLPVNQGMIRIYYIGGYFFFKLQNGLSLVWNGKDAMQITVNQCTATCGLCGSMHSVSVEDSFLRHLKYAIRTNGETCLPQRSNPPNRTVIEAGKEFCSRIKKYTSSCRTSAINSIINMCALEYSHSNEDKQSACPSFSEAARQCSRSANYSEVNAWRSDPEIKCDNPVCEGNMEFKECGSVSQASCKHQELQPSSYCIGACNCPEGLVLNDLVQNGICIPKSQCPCEYKGHVYPPGAKRESPCESYECYEGKWKSKSKSCPGRCKIEDGPYVSTFDGINYSIKHKCAYYALMTTDYSVISVMDECKDLAPGLCMQSVTLIILKPSLHSFTVMDNGTVTKDGNVITLPYSEDVIISEISSFFLQMNNKLGLQMQIQTNSNMQLYITLSKNGQVRTAGLCGTLNGKASDDYTSLHNITEQNPEIFAKTWSTDACTNPAVQPPSHNLVNEEYTKYCGLLKDPSGTFSSCHYLVDYTTYYKNCQFVTANSNNPKESMCNALGNYVKACSYEGQSIVDWRNGSMCEVECKNNMVFKYNVSTCNQTCRSLTQFDPACTFEADPVEGCGCPEGMFTSLEGVCVPKEKCECYTSSDVIRPGDSYAFNGLVCKCENGELKCTSEQPVTEQCYNGTKYVNCRNSYFVTERTCSDWNTTAVKICKPGCYCPESTARFGDTCVPFEKCPCRYAGKTYPTQSEIKMQCDNTCTCSTGTWSCTEQECSTTCHAYGNGRYRTFDGTRYSYNADCENILVENFCGKDKGTFRISIEGISCCEPEAICSKIIKIAFKNRIITLKDASFTVDSISNSCEDEPPEYTIHTIGLKMFIVLNGSVTIIWDKKNHVSVVLDPFWKGGVCGLCGNNNGIVKDDFTTRDNKIVADAFIFGNSWATLESMCSARKTELKQCEDYPQCNPWAVEVCNIIKENVFKECHTQVDYQPFYDDCMKEACICDMEEKNAIVCTITAMYADACASHGVCTEWRTPNICPVWCHYYDGPGECSWHYEPCGTPEMQTCSGHALNETFSTMLEGCYAKCPDSAPYLDEIHMKCVQLYECSCLHDGVIVPAGKRLRFAKDGCDVICECTDGRTTCWPTSDEQQQYQDEQQKYQDEQQQDQADEQQQDQADEQQEYQDEQQQNEDEQQQNEDEQQQYQADEQQQYHVEQQQYQAEQQQYQEQNFDSGDNYDW